MFFLVPKHKALKLAIENNYSLQKTFINFYKLQLLTGTSNNWKTDKITRKKNFGLKDSKNDLFTLRYSQYVHHSFLNFF